MLYALGALGMFSSLYEIEDIAMTIFNHDFLTSAL